ncbi:MAG: molybdopterin-dependent oxidoreductase [Oscillospiraceae bacterium]|jgi:hypothetical protein
MKRRAVYTAALAAALFCVLILSACGPVRVTADLSAYGDTPITIAGLGETEFQVTANALSGLACVSQGVSGKTAKAGSIQAVGPTLETFLAQYGKKISDFTRIRVEAKDGYKQGFLQEKLQEYTFILAVANGNQPLGEEEAPLRLIIPGAPSNEWVRMVTRIEFIAE